MREELRLPVADAVLPRAGSAESDRAFRQPLGEAPHSRELRRVLRVDEEAHVEVPVTDVAHDRRDETGGVDLRAGLGDTACERARSGRTRRCTNPFAPGRSASAASYAEWRAAQRCRRSSSLRRPREVARAELLRQASDLLSLLSDLTRRSRGTRGRAWARPGRPSPERRLTASIWTSSRSSIRATGIPSWIAPDDTADGVVERGEGAHGRRDRLRGRVDPERHLRDHAERPLRANEEAREVVSRRRLSRPASGYARRVRPPVTTVSERTFSRIAP